VTAPTNSATTQTLMSAADPVPSAGSHSDPSYPLSTPTTNVVRCKINDERICVTIDTAKSRLRRLNAELDEKHRLIPEEEHDMMRHFVQSFNLLYVLKHSKPAQPVSLLYYAMSSDENASREVQRKQVVACFCGHIDRYYNISRHVRKMHSELKKCIESGLFTHDPAKRTISTRVSSSGSHGASASATMTTATATTHSANSRATAAPRTTSNTNGQGFLSDERLGQGMPGQTLTAGDSAVSSVSSSRPAELMAHHEVGPGGAGCPSSIWSTQPNIPYGLFSWSQFQVSPMHDALYLAPSPCTPDEANYLLLSLFLQSGSVVEFASTPIDRLIKPSEWPALSEQSITLLDLQRHYAKEAHTTFSRLAKDASCFALSVSGVDCHHAKDFVVFNVHLSSGVFFPLCFVRVSPLLPEHVQRAQLRKALTAACGTFGLGPLKHIPLTPNASRAATLAAQLLCEPDGQCLYVSCPVDRFCVHLQWLLLEVPFASLAEVQGTDAHVLLGTTTLQAELETYRKLQRLITLLHACSPAQEALQSAFPASAIPHPADVHILGSLRRMIVRSREIGVSKLCEQARAHAEVTVEWSPLDERYLIELAEVLDLLAQLLWCISDHSRTSAVSGILAVLIVYQRLRDLQATSERLAVQVPRGLVRFVLSLYDHWLLLLDRPLQHHVMAGLVHPFIPAHHWLLEHLHADSFEALFSLTFTLESSSSQVSREAIRALFVEELARFRAEQVKIFETALERQLLEAQAERGQTDTNPIGNQRALCVRRTTDRLLFESNISAWWDQHRSIYPWLHSAFSFLQTIQLCPLSPDLSSVQLLINATQGGRLPDLGLLSEQALLSTWSNLYPNEE